MSQRSRGDGGVTLVLLAVLLVVLLGFAAFAVDMGGLYNERRQDQSTADAAAMAGALELRSISAATDLAIDYAERNTGAVPGGLDFDACPVDDPDRLAVSAPGAACISFNESRTRIRVRLPERQYPATFGRVIGAESFGHSATAIAQRVRVGFGGILPFGIPSLGSGGGLVCPASLPAGLSYNLPPCEGAAAGNFGFLDVGLWEINDCPGTNPAGRIAPNIAMGSDHELEIYQGILETEEVNCPDGATPNALGGQTGNMPGRLAEGLYSGADFSDGDAGRLLRVDDQLFGGASGSEWPRRLTRPLSGGRAADVTPLWYFIPPTLPANAPASCRREVFVHPDGTPRTDLSGVEPAEFRTALRAAIPASEPERRMVALLDRCISHFQGQPWGDTPWGVSPAQPSSCATSCQGPIFALRTSAADSGPFDIQLTPRFGYVPEFASDWEAGPGNSQPSEPIVRFRAIFIQASCLTNPCGREDVLHAGFSGPGAPAANQAGGFVAWGLPDGMLPGGLGGPDGPNVQPNIQVQLIR